MRGRADKRERDREKETGTGTGTFQPIVMRRIIGGTF